MPGWLRAAVSEGGALREAATHPKRFVLGIVVGWLVDKFVTPFVDAILSAGETVVEAILLVFGVGPTRTGLADVPMLIVGPLIDAAEPAAATILSRVDTFNHGIEAAAASAGLAGPPIVTLLWVAEVTLVFGILWAIVRIVDVPIINLGPLLKTLAAPVRFVFGVIR